MTDAVIPPTLAAALTDRYRIERELGQGGMATVYLAHDLRHDRKVALKILRPELAAVIGAERFLAEIKTTANLQHPHILPLFDSGRVDGSVFYVMPFVQGESLRDRLAREKQLPIEEAVRIAREVADALAAAHAAGIIHRDIKPENILLQGNHALVADFGIALAASRADGTGRMTETGMSLGTPHYMSPEQALGERTLDVRTDIYALGCVLYEMLVGEPPFTGPTAQAILAKVMTERPTPIQATRDTVPSALEAATFKALAKLPADRYASASAFAEALTRLDERPARAAGRASNARVIAMTALLTLAVAGAVYWGLNGRGTRESPATGEPRRYSIALPDSAPLAPVYNAIYWPTRSLAVAPDGRSVVYVAGTPRGHRLWLLRLDEPGADELPGTEDAQSPTFSPDSRQIAFIQGGSIRRMSLDTRSGVSVAELPRGLEAVDIRWGLDGELYFTPVLYQGPCLFAVPATGGPARAVGAGAAAATRNCMVGAAVPGSEWIGVSSDRKIGVLSTGAQPSQFRELAAGAHPMFLPGNLVAFIREGTAFGAELDPGTMRILGEPQALFSGLRREAGGALHWGLTSDGTLVWVAGPSGRFGRLVWADATGQVQDSLPVEAGVVRSIALSPDGRRLALQTLREDKPARVRVVDLVGHVVDEVPGSEELTPAWTDGGRGLLLSPEGGDATLVARLSNRGWVTDTTDAGYQNASRTGEWRCGDRSGQLAFWRRDAPKRAIPLGAPGYYCSFSPDERWLQWTVVTGDAIYLIPTDATGAEARIKVAGAGFYEGRWQPDSRGFYIHKTSAWYVVRVPTHPNEQPTPPRQVLSGNFNTAIDWSFDVGPDGRLLLIQGSAPTRATRLEVMTNFPAYVRAKLAESAKP